MFAKFYINISEVRKLRSFSMLEDGCHVKSINTDVVRKRIRPFLKSLVRGDTSEGDVLDGEALKNFVFPTGEVGTYDVFISYSHTDMDDAILLASWLEQQCGLKVFLDYYVWGSADGLLLDIDNHYCKQKNGHYNYRRRNYSTSHVHAMLSMAIMDVINNTECCIFLNSGHSICLTNLLKSTSVKTLSPWIYEENKMMRLLPPRLVKREVKYFSAIEKANITVPLNELMIKYEVSFEGVKTLTFESLRNLKGKGLHGLDELYGSLVGVKVLND